MADLHYVITEPCIGVKDTACVDACPVDCIHPRKNEAEFANAPMLFINPNECIDCGACEPACPVTAIFPPDCVPAGQELLVEANHAFYEKSPEAAYGLVQKHLDSKNK